MHQESELGGVVGLESHPRGCGCDVRTLRVRTGSSVGNRRSFWWFLNSVSGVDEKGRRPLWGRLRGEIRLGESRLFGVERPLNNNVQSEFNRLFF